MSGGFVVEDTEARSAAPEYRLATDKRTPLLSLTPRQEAKLRQHLDDRLTQLERDEKKHAFGTLESLLPRLTSILNLILQIPPAEPFGSLRIRYLLTFTGAMTNYITSLPLIPPSMAIPTGSGADLDEIQRAAGRVMTQYLDFISLVDEAWISVLRGQAWLAPEIQGGKGIPVHTQFGSQVGVTERTRLKSILLAGKDKVMAWARLYGRSSATTEVEDEDGMDNELESTGWDWEDQMVHVWQGTLQLLVDPDHVA